MSKCKDCRDTGWVCESHPTQPWTGTHGCGCGASGTPCPQCSALIWNKPPDVSKLSRSGANVAGEEGN
jgi:hypothetical protein